MPAAGLLEAGWLCRGHRQKRGCSGQEHGGDPATQTQHAAVDKQVGAGQNGQAKRDAPGDKPNTVRAGAPRLKRVTKGRLEPCAASVNGSRAWRAVLQYAALERAPAFASRRSSGVRRKPG